MTDKDKIKQLETDLKAMTTRAERSEATVSSIAGQRHLLLKEEPTNEQIKMIKTALKLESDRSVIKIWQAVRDAIKRTNPKV